MLTKLIVKSYQDPEARKMVSHSIYVSIRAGIYQYLSLLLRLLTLPCSCSLVLYKCLFFFVCTDLNLQPQARALRCGRMSAGHAANRRGSQRWRQSLKVTVEQNPRWCDETATASDRTTYWSSLLCELWGHIVTSVVERDRD